MTVCLSFDDGRLDQYTNAFQILKKYNLVGTFHITTGYIDGSFNATNFIGSPVPMTIDNVLEMEKSGMEISSHGDMHMLNADDFLCSIRKFNDWGIKTEKFGFSVPNSFYEKDLLSKFVEQVSPSIEYVRVGRSDKCYSLLNKIRYGLDSTFGISSSYVKFNQNNIIESFDKFKIVSLVVKRKTKLSSLLKLIKLNANSNALLVIMFHSIVDNPSTQWGWRKDQFDSLCKFLSGSREIKVDTLMNFTQNIG